MLSYTLANKQLENNKLELKEKQNQIDNYKPIETDPIAAKNCKNEDFLFSQADKIRIGKSQEPQLKISNPRDLNHINFIERENFIDLANETKINFDKGLQRTKLGNSDPQGMIDFFQFSCHLPEKTAIFAGITSVSLGIDTPLNLARMINAQDFIDDQMRSKIFILISYTFLISLELLYKYQTNFSYILYL